MQPNQNQTGKFVCEVNAVSESGHIVTFTESTEVIASPPTVSELVTYVGQLNKQVVDLKQQNNVVITETADLKQKYDNLRQDHDNLKQDHDNMKTKVDTKVFFSAKRSSELLTSSNSAVVVYDKVLANVGGAYNKATGEFICRISGYYQFHLTMLKNTNRRTYSHLKHNDQIIASVYNPHTSTEDSLPSASLSK